MTERERLAQVWEEGALWAAVECGAIRSEREPWLVPSDNPYRLAKVRVGKDGYDWVAECTECDNSKTWCSDWEAAMEAAYGHLAMHHGISKERERERDRSERALRRE